jgi:hypothetical protein
MSTRPVDRGGGVSIAGRVESGNGALGEVAGSPDCHSSCMSARMAPTRRMTAGSLGNIPPRGSALDLPLLTRSSVLVLPILGQCGRGNAVNASTSVFALSIRVPIFGNRPASWPRTSSQLAATVAGSG